MSELYRQAGEFEDKLGKPEAAAAIKNLDIASGPFTDNYEKFVHKIFTPAGYAEKSAKHLAEYTDMASFYSPDNPLPDIPPSLMSRMERMEDKTDLEHHTIFSPLEMMYTYYSQCGMEDQPYTKYPVYQPKTSSEYYSVMNKTPKIGETPAVAYKVARTHTIPNIWSKPVYDSEEFRISTDSRRSIIPSKPHHMLLDYKEGQAKSPYLYPRYDFVHRSDSKIVGSNFVMLNLRQDDPWKHRVDKLLEQSRSTDYLWLSQAKEAFWV